MSEMLDKALELFKERKYKEAIDAMRSYGGHSND